MSDFKRTRVERLKSEFRSSQCLSEVGEHETESMRWGTIWRRGLRLVGNGTPSSWD